MDIDGSEETLEFIEFRVGNQERFARLAAVLNAIKSVEYDDLQRPPPLTGEVLALFDEEVKLRLWQPRPDNSSTREARASVEAVFYTIEQQYTLLSWKLIDNETARNLEFTRILICMVISGLYDAYCKHLNAVY